MRNLRALSAVTAGILAACSSSAPPAGTPGPSHALTAELLDAQAHVVAVARVTAHGDDSVAVVIDANAALPTGPHGVHLHAVGKCEAPTFASAGPHLNPSARKHGLQNPDGPHAGDMPNLEGTHGSFVAAATMHDLTGADGSAIVIHVTRDDQTTDPSGNSGARIACGVLSAPAAKAKAP